MFGNCPKNFGNFTMVSTLNPCSHCWSLTTCTPWMPKEIQKAPMTRRRPQVTVKVKRKLSHRAWCMLFVWLNAWRLGMDECCLCVQVPKPRTWNRGSKPRSWNWGFFFFSPFYGGLPRVNIRVFFFRPFPAGCPGLIPGFFFFTLFRRAAQG